MRPGLELNATPVLISAEESCRVELDGSEMGTIIAGGVLKADLAAGEHLIATECGGKTERKAFVVGKEQKVLLIGEKGTDKPLASSNAPSQAPGWTGCGLRQNAAGQWIVGVVVSGTPCDRAEIRPGQTVVSVAGRTSGLTAEELSRLDAGEIGSHVEWQVENALGELRKIDIVRGEIPEEGLLRLLVDSSNVKVIAYSREKPIESAIREALAAETGSATSETRAQSAQRCVGFPTACAGRLPGACGSGCELSGRCSGFSNQTCLGKPQFSCVSIPGCSWSTLSKSCYGMGRTCLGQLNAFSCALVSGCSWQQSCSGRPTPCSQLSQAICSWQPGCSWR